jgi:ankyrin repeat protein
LKSGNPNGSVLMWAAMGAKDPTILKALVDRGADVNKRGHNGETAVMIAAQYNRTPGVIEALRTAGAVMAAKDDQGQNALDFFRRNGNKVAEQALLGR